jgi:hypothetical protein
VGKGAPGMNVAPTRDVGVAETRGGSSVVFAAVETCPMGAASVGVTATEVRMMAGLAIGLAMERPVADWINMDQRQPEQQKKIEDTF